MSLCLRHRISIQTIHVSGCVLCHQSLRSPRPSSAPHDSFKRKQRVKEATILPSGHITRQKRSSYAYQKIYASVGHPRRVDMSLLPELEQAFVTHWLWFSSDDVVKVDGTFWGKTAPLQAPNVAVIGCWQYVSRQSPIQIRSIRTTISMSGKSKLQGTIDEAAIYSHRIYIRGNLTFDPVMNWHLDFTNDGIHLEHCNV